MRPDKKKTRHHDSLKCEAKAKQKAAEKAKKEQKAQGPKAKPSPTVEPTPSSSSSQDPDFYSHRKVASNWTKYEIPSDEDSDAETATGLDFNFVLENSAKASDHLQLKAEKEWETKHETEYHQDLFALNLTDLEAKLDSIPLYDLIGFHTENLDVSVFSIKKVPFYLICDLGRNEENPRYLCQRRRSKLE